MKKRVVILSAFLSPYRSGAEACVEEVAKALATEYDITIVTAKLSRTRTPHPDPDPDPIPYHVKYVGLGIPADKWLFPFLAPFAARKLKPDLIHAILETFAGLALVFCRFTCGKTKRLLTMQTTNRSLLKKTITMSPDAVTAISRILKDMAEGYGRTDVTLIPNGVPLAGLSKAREETTKVPGRIVFVGRIEKMKGIDTLIEAMRILTEKHGVGDAHLHIVGAGSQEESLKQISHNNHVADRVTFVGRQEPPNLYKSFAEAEVFCGLSRSEAQGIVFLEAQAAGCAIVATDVGGIPDYTPNGKVGLLIPPNDPDAAAAALAQILTDDELRKSMQQAGIENAGQYDWGRIAERYREVWNILLL